MQYLIGITHQYIKIHKKNLFRYQIDNLRFAMTPEQFSKAIRKDIPLDNFSDDYKNVKRTSNQY